MGTTTKHLLPWPAGTDLISQGDDAIRALAEDLDDLIAVDDQGLLADRPVSTPGSPGKVGRYYKATDVGVLYRDHGTGWDPIAYTGDQRGKAIIPAEQSTGETGYTLLSTADQVAGIVVPTGGVLVVSYSALVKATGGTANAAIFLNSQLKKPDAGGAPLVLAASIPAQDWDWLYTTDAGMTVESGAGDASAVGTGMLRGRPLEIDVDPGTYTVSVKYKTQVLLNTVSAKDRKLRVEARAFPS